MTWLKILWFDCKTFFLSNLVVLIFISLLIIQNINMLRNSLPFLKILRVFLILKLILRFFDYTQNIIRNTWSVFQRACLVLWLFPSWFSLHLGIILLNRNKKFPCLISTQCAHKLTRIIFSGLIIHYYCEKGNLNVTRVLSIK